MKNRSGVSLRELGVRFASARRQENAGVSLRQLALGLRKVGVGCPKSSIRTTTKNIFNMPYIYIYAYIYT